MARRDDDHPITPAELARAERGAALVAAAMADPAARAPQRLRESLEHARGARGARRARLGLTPARLLTAGGALAVALAALVIAVGAIGDGSPGAGPTVAQVAAVGRLPVRDRPPQRLGGAMPQLAARVQGVAFPDWTGAFGWAPTGRRSDSVAGRDVTTVSYADATGATLGYSIVAGAPIGGAAAGADVVRRSTRYRVATQAGRTVVTWTRAGRTCVIDAPSSVPAGELVALAAWSNV